MGIDQMRKKIASVYDGMSWKVKCQKMPDNQVLAIYHKFLEEGRFKKKRKEVKDQGYQQMTIFDYI